MSSQIISSNDKLRVRQVIVEALLADVSGDTVILNIGTKSGIKVGDQLSVERVTREIRDPGTGNVLRRMTDKLGVIEVTEVDNISAVCRVISGNGFLVGDLAKTVTQ